MVSLGIGIVKTPREDEEPFSEGFWAGRMSDRDKDTATERESAYQAYRRGERLHRADSNRTPLQDRARPFAMTKTTPDGRFRVAIISEGFDPASPMAAQEIPGESMMQLVQQLEGLAGFCRMAIDPDLQRQTQFTETLPALLAKLRERFDAMLVAEVNRHNGIPSLPVEEIELRDTIAELLGIAAPRTIWPTG
jgi:hypothetical protein